MGYVNATSRAVMLAALSLGVLLVGIELFITAVALPRIFLDLSSWSELRRASWIINAYLVSYIAVMPLAGRAADRFGLPRLVMLALAVFGAGSLMCGAAQTLDQLLVGRTIQGAGAGALLPLATAGASHLYGGAARSRALGIIGAATFLGMAIGPVLGVLVLGQLGLRDALAGAGIWSGPLVDLLTPAWRWIFYVTAPLALLAIVYVWAASPDWDVAPGRSHMDALGAVLASTALASGLLAITLVGDDMGQLPVIAIAGAVALVTGVLAGVRMLRTPEPFLDLRLFADRVFSSAVLISLLTGYALATVIVGIATYVDRVRFGPLDEQLVVLGSLALAMSVGAFASGFSLRLLSATAVTVLGLAASVAGLVVLSGFRPDSDMRVVVAGLVAFGLGFGLTVTPRSVAAVEAAGRRAYGMASAAVTVARMAGMALGMAILTAFGTTRIDSVTEAFNDQILPPDLVGRTMADPLVLDALERWAAGEAASVLGSLFLVAAAILVVAVLPAFMMRDTGSRQGRRPDGAPSGLEERDEAVEGAIAGF
jgi:MFS family permease